VIKINSIEEIKVIGSEILVFDGADYHIDYVDVSPDSGAYYMANGTSPTHWDRLSYDSMSKDRQIVLMLINSERELLKEFDHEDLGVAARCEHAAIRLARKEAQRILRGE
jgi:hypothetical protein